MVAARANQPGAVRDTLCFVVQSKIDESTMWIAAANGDPELSMALRLCKQIKINQLNDVGVENQTDHAPQSQAARDVGALAFGHGSSSQRKQKPTKK